MMMTTSPINSSSESSSSNSSISLPTKIINSSTAASFTTKRKFGLSINIDQPQQSNSNSGGGKIIPIDIKEMIYLKDSIHDQTSQVIQDSDSPSTPLSMLSLSFSSNSNTASDISSDSSNSQPNTPRNKLNLKLNLQQLSQPKVKMYSNNYNNANLINQYNNNCINSNNINNGANGNTLLLDEDEEPLESSRWLGGSELDKFKIYDLICSKVTDYLYMGSETIASNMEILKSYGITHIINASYQCPNYFEQESTKPFIYKKFPLKDNPSEEISLVFSEVIEFIESALSVNGKIFVHCQMGVSRSPCLCMLWLMKSDRCTLEEASDRIKLIRPISRPNAGFQLSLLNWAINQGIQSQNSHRSSYNNSNNSNNNNNNNNNLISNPLVPPVKFNNCNCNVNQQN